MSVTRQQATDSTAKQPPLLRLSSGVSAYLANLRLFSRNARLFLVGSFLMGINLQAFQVLLNLYLKEQGYLEGDIGLVASSRAIGMTIMAIPAALVMARYRLRPFLIASCILSALFSILIVNSASLALLIGTSILAGVSFSLWQVASGPFFMRNSSPKERTYLFSSLFGTSLLAGIIGAAICGRAATMISEVTGDMVRGYQYTLLAGVAVSLLALIPFFSIRRSSPVDGERRLSLSGAQWRARKGFYLKIFLVNFTIGAGAGLIIPFLNLYFRDRFQLAPDTIGLFYSVVHISMLIGALAGPLLAAKLGLVRTVVFTQLLSIPFMLTLSYTYTLPLATVAFILRGGLMNLGVPIVTTLSMELAHSNEHGLVGAILALGWTSSWMFTTALGGHLIEQYGYTVTMNITVVLYVIASVMFYRFFHSAERRNSGSAGWTIVREVSA